MSSIPGDGTALRIRIPLTLAIIPGLVVVCAGDRYAIPQASLLELVRLEGEQALQRIEHVYGAAVCRLRGRLLPLVRLDEALGLAHGPWRPDPASVVNIVVLQAEGTPFGVIVDGILDTEEIVVKPLGRQLKGITEFAGATIMGDGKVALILDVLGLAQQRGMVGAGQERTLGDVVPEPRTDTERRAEPVQLLLAGLGAEHRIAFPLSAISRLEELDRRTIERAGPHEVVQYRGRILPLIRLDRLLDGIVPRDLADDLLRVVVYEHDGQSIGFVVDRILDVVETTVTLHRRSRAGAIAGSAIVQGQVTDVLDVPVLMARITQRDAHTSNGAHTGA